MAPSERNLTVVNGFQFLERITSDRILQLKTYFEQLFRNKQLKQTEDQILSTEAFDSYKMRKSIFQLVLNSHGTSWQQTAKIVLNANNGGNEHDSSKIAEETLPEIQRRIFWCNKIFPKRFLRQKFHRK